MSTSSSIKRSLWIIGAIFAGFIVFLVYRAQRAVKELTPAPTVRKKPKERPILATSTYHPSIRIYGAKYKKGKKGTATPRPAWTGTKPNLPSHKELMRRVRSLRTYPKNLPKVHKPGSAHYRIKRSAFRAWLNKPLAENGSRFEPNFQGGRPQGMRVTRIDPGSFYERLGLYKGDILLQVNGRKIYTPGHALKHYKRVAQRYRSLTLTFKRGGRTHTVDFDLLADRQK